jgi:hypothetical protein
MTPNPAAAAIAREDFALHALPIELINAAVAAYRLLAAAFPNKVGIQISLPSLLRYVAGSVMDDRAQRGQPLRHSAQKIAGRRIARILLTSPNRRKKHVWSF